MGVAYLSLISNKKVNLCKKERMEEKENYYTSALSTNYSEHNMSLLAVYSALFLLY